jgi:hypothetical protein
MPSSRNVEPVSDSTPTQSRKKQKKQEKKKQKKLLLKAANNTESIAQSPKIDQVFMLVYDY